MQLMWNSIYLQAIDQQQQGRITQMFTPSGSNICHFLHPLISHALQRILPMSLASFLGHIILLISLCLATEFIGSIKTSNALGNKLLALTSVENYHRDLFLRIEIKVGITFSSFWPRFILNTSQIVFQYCMNRKKSWRKFSAEVNRGHYRANGSRKQMLGATGCLRSDGTYSFLLH